MKVTAELTAQSLYMIYRQLPTETQQKFKQLMADEEREDPLENTGWLIVASETLRDDWDAPENNVWDEFYKQQTERRGELSAR